MPQAGLSVWAPGMWLMRRLSLRRKVVVLLLSAWLPLLALLLLLINGQVRSISIGGFDSLHSLAVGPSGPNELPRWVPSGMLATAFLASLYLAACVGKALFEVLDLVRGSVRDMAEDKPHIRPNIGGSDELGQLLHALDVAGERLTQLRGAVEHSARELSDVHLAMQMQAHEVRSATSEIARRTVALCGMLDSDIQDVQRTSVDLEAIQDEELQTLQLMASLRARLLSLASHCQALGEAARGVAATQLQAAGEPGNELAAAASVDITYCHQLSERVGGAERLNERRIESMRLSTDRLACRAERGMREGQQLMVLTRQVDTSLANTMQRLQKTTATIALLRSLVDMPAPEGRHL